MAENIGFYDIVKNCKGTLALVLPAYDMTSQPRVVEIPHNVKKVRVPRTFALGIFTDGTLERMYKDGSFRVEPEKQFEAEVAEIFYPVENKAKIVDDASILDMLKKGNRVGIKKLLEEDNTNRDNVIILARENIGDIPTSMVDDLNNILQVELQIDNA